MRLPVDFVVLRQASSCLGGYLAVGIGLRIRLSGIRKALRLPVDFVVLRQARFGLGSDPLVCPLEDASQGCRPTLIAHLGATLRLGQEGDIPVIVEEGDTSLVIPHLNRPQRADPQPIDLQLMPPEVVRQGRCVQWRHRINEVGHQVSLSVVSVISSSSPWRG